MNPFTKTVTAKILRTGGSVAILLGFFTAQTAIADDFLWLPADSNDGLWGNASNWQDAAVAFAGTGDPTVTFPPSQIIDRAIIGYSNTPNIILDTTYNIDSIGIGGGTFGEPSIGTDYLGTSETLTLSGAGFIANPYSTSPITAGMVAIFGSGSLQLRNSASLNFVGIDNSATLVFADSSSAGTGGINNHGLVSFENNSSGYQANIQNESSGVIQLLNSATLGAGSGVTLDNAGTINLYDSSNAGSQSINNEAHQQINFYNNSSASHSGIFTAGQVNFYGSSSAANAAITTTGNSGLGEWIAFFNNSTAGHATVDNYQITNFNDHSTAGSSQINNHGSSSTLTFNNFSTAGQSTISNMGGAVIFKDSSSAGTAAITNNGTVSFGNQASAGNSTITNEASITFAGQASAAGARIINDGDGSFVDISNTTQGAALGELSGGGAVYLGSNALTVGTLGTDSSFGGDIQDGGANSGSGGSLIKDGAGTFTLTGHSHFTGGVTVLAGTLELDSSAALPNYSSLQMGGGKFLYYNPATSDGISGTVFGPVTFQSGASEVDTALGAGSANTNSYLVIDQLNPRSTGATGDFSVSNLSAQGQTSIVIGTGTQTIVGSGGLNTSAERAVGFLDPGFFVNGNSYAWYDPVKTGGSGVRAINYNGDSGAFTTGATTGIATSSSHLYVQTTGAVSAQQTATFTTLNLASADDFTLADGATVSLASILKTGGGTSTISGGNALQATIAASTGTELVVYTAQDNVLNIDTPVSADVLTKSGAGLLNLNGYFNGQLYFNEGSIATSSTVTGTVTAAHSSFTLGSAGRVNGNVNLGAGGTLGGSGAVSGKVTVSSGGSTYPGDPQILSAGSVEYQSGSTAQFSIATSSSSSHPPIAGVDFDQLRLTAGSGTVLQIDPGVTTLQLNLTASSLAAVETNAQNNISDNYFLFVLGNGTSSGLFTDLTITEGTNTYAGSITNGVATINQLGLEFDFSYSANSTTNSLSGGNDLAFTVVSVSEPVPEPGTWLLLAGGLVLLVGLRKRQSRAPGAVSGRS